MNTPEIEYDEAADDGDVQEYLARPHSQRAITALVFAILGILTVNTGGGFVAGIVAVVLSHLAVRDIRRGGRRGWATAQWAMAIGYLATLGGLAVLITDNL